MHPLRIALVGQGKLGSSILALAKEDPLLSFQSLRAHQVYDHIHSLDLILDVSVPECFTQYIHTATRADVGVVVGVTGYTEEQLKEIHEAATSIPLMLCPNFSYGIALLEDVLPRLPQNTYQLHDIHHTQKRDAPSGTAKQLAKALKGPVSISSERKGSIVGIHKITLPLAHETITITHEAHSRDLFAIGAIKACQFLYGKPRGLYTHYYEQDPNPTPIHR